jgi:hypothetical protein
MGPTSSTGVLSFLTRVPKVVLDKPFDLLGLKALIERRRRGERLSAPLTGKPRYREPRLERPGAERTGT